jgi:serine/threonine-protein kinase
VVNNHRNEWIYHIIRREAESLILPNLYEFLKGKYAQSNNEERLALAEGCQYTHHPLAAAGLYAHAFTVDSALADDLHACHRFNAARVATLAASRETDAADLSGEECARWRAQAYAWLRSDLDAWAKALDASTATNDDEAKAKLLRWRYDPDLASLRDTNALERLPPAEREQLNRLWNDFEHVLHRVNRCGTD